ncbi:predicted protein [Coccidioides posadasii str. Silveira]|uniref:Predicted protein n=2 Tax=Coccidioides posadasii TaxID=199306 RepID=E9D4K3_COCPS|nr:predicted protein [Coccidioides posadasii str. Silveira]KMM66183.1 hypothetical protein CPAG_02523 [Coccidioides posadasii RMSCC 3488]
MAGPNKLVTHHSTSFDFGPASTGAMIGQEIVPGLGELVLPYHHGGVDTYMRTMFGVHQPDCLYQHHAYLPPSPSTRPLSSPFVSPSRMSSAKVNWIKHEY